VFARQKVSSAWEKRGGPGGERKPQTGMGSQWVSPSGDEEMLVLGGAGKLEKKVCPLANEIKKPQKAIIEKGGQ